MSLNREQLLSRKAPSPQQCPLPGGGEVLMKVPVTADYRAYQASLRNKDGDFIDARLERGDELLIATLVIVPETKDRMFSVDDVMGGVFDSVPAADVNAMSAKAYELYGKTKAPKLLTDEDREKNLSETASSE